MSPPSAACAPGFFSLLCSSTSFMASPAMNSSLTEKRTSDWKLASVWEGESWNWALTSSTLRSMNTCSHGTNTSFRTTVASTSSKREESG